MDKSKDRQALDTILMQSMLLIEGNKPRDRLEELLDATFGPISQKVKTKRSANRKKKRRRKQAKTSRKRNRPRGRKRKRKQ